MNQNIAKLVILYIDRKIKLWTSKYIFEKKYWKSDFVDTSVLNTNPIQFQKTNKSS